MKQMEFSILGQVYVLGCPDGGETLLAKAVAAVDREMAGIRDAGKVRARERIAVLAALNLAYQLAEQGPAAAAANAAAPAATLPQAQIDALIGRLDHALGADGQLL
jgi:cell division protein ZapA